VRVEVADTGDVLATHVEVAVGPGSRMRGLLGKRPLESGEGLLLEPAAQVHTLGMSFPIDVVFCNRERVVVHIVRAMRPWRITKWVRGARSVLELAAGTVSESVTVGTRLRFYDGFSNGQ
jgi:uncharacterized membrane protein (UPF0127 family)